VEITTLLWNMVVVVLVGICQPNCHDTRRTQDNANTKNDTNTYYNLRTVPLL